MVLKHTVHGKILGVLVFAAFAPWLSGFVLISGNDEAKLPASPDQPVVEFVLDDSMPKFSGKGKFLDGRYKDLSDEEFWPVLVEETMNRWNAVSSAYIELRLASGGSPSLDADDGINSIVVGKTNYSAAAFAAPNIKDDEITDCDIKVSNNQKVAANVLASTIVHELGHCLGLGHNHTNYGAIMGYSSGSTTMTLGADDIAGVTYLYPDPDADADEPKELIGCAVIADSPSSTNTWLVLFLIAALPFSVALTLAYRSPRNTFSL